MKMKKKISIGVVVFLFLVLLLILNVCAEEKKTIEDYVKDSGAVKMFGDLSGEQKSSVWEESKGLGDEAVLTRSAIALELIKQINQNKLSKDIAAGQERMIINNWGNYVFEQLKSKGLTEYNGIKIESYSQLRELAAKAGVDLDSKLTVQIEKLKGFGSTDLSWSKNGKNVIGNGKTWLDLDKLPYGVNGITYDEENKRFILKTKNGNELIVGEGATDEKGNLVSLSNVEKDSALGKAIFPQLLKDGQVGLDSLLLEGNGKVVFNKDGFEISGSGTKLKIGEFIFSRESGDGNGRVSFSNNIIIINGIKFERKDYVRVSSTNFDFILNFDVNPNNVASHNKNFLSMGGENFAVGGNGNIEILRNLNGLRAFDCKEFRVNVGDVNLVFRENGIYKGSQNSFKNAFTIDNIYAIANNKPLEEPFKIVKSGEVYTLEGANFVAGKQTALGPMGASLDVSVVVNKDDLSKIKKSVQGAWFFPESSLMDSMRNSKYSYSFDFYVPVEGLTVSSDSKIKNEFVVSQMKEKLNEALSSSFNLPTIKGERQLTDESKEIINKLADQFVGEIIASSFSGGKYSLRFNNIPGSDPTISLIIPGNAEKTISFNKRTSSFVSQVMDLGLRVPDIQFDSTGRLVFKSDEKLSISSSYTIFGREVPSWPPVHLKELWYRYLGQETSGLSGFIPFTTTDRQFLKAFSDKRTKAK